MITTDLWFSAFLMLKGYSLKGYTSNNHKGTYEFNIPDEELVNLKMEFHNSDISKVKYYQEQLKDLCY